MIKLILHRVVYDVAHVFTYNNRRIIGYRHPVGRKQGPPSNPVLGGRMDP